MPSAAVRRMPAAPKPTHAAGRSASGASARAAQELAALETKVRLDMGTISDVARELGRKAIHQLRWYTGEPMEGTARPVVLEDPAGANELTKREQDRMSADLRQNQPLEDAALGRLSQADRNRYRIVRDALDPWAARALQAMLLRGDLPGAPALREGQRTLDLLQRMVTQDLAAGLDRRRLMNELVLELEMPLRVEQRQKGTCVATTAQILLMQKHPAEFVRIVSGLASPSGRVVLAGGRTAVRESDWQATNDGMRTSVARLVQPALMEAASPFGYDNTRDKAVIGSSIGVGGGLSPFASASLNTQLEGSPYTARLANRWNREELVSDLKKALAAGKGPIPASVVWEGGGGHAIQIERIADGKVTYINPWGQREQMTEEAFRTDLRAIEMPR